MKITKDISQFANLLPATGLPAYLQSFNDCLDYGYVSNDECVLPFVVRKRLFIKYIQLATPTLGAVSEKQEKEFLYQTIQCLKSSYSAVYIVSTNTSIFETFPDNSMFCKFGSYRIDLEKPEEDLFAALHSKHRNVIRKAQKDGLVVLYGKEYLNDCFDLIHETFARQGMLSPTLDNIKRLNSLDEYVLFSIVKVQDEIQGAAIFVWNPNHSCFYLHGGSNANPHSGAMNLLHWETMMFMKKQGVKLYDFVGGRINTEKGSRLEGIQRFKARFGGEFAVGYLWKYILNKPAYRIYTFILWAYFNFIRREKYDGDAIDQERKKGNI